jgi:hypothetical protein
VTNFDFLPFAHALVARQDLPIPAWLFAWGASIVLIASFYALSVGWKEPRFEQDTWRPLGGEAPSRVLLGRPAQALYGLIGVFLLWVVVYSGLHGTVAPDRNFAVTFVFVTAWLGFPLLGVLAGDVFRAFSPWRAAGRAAGWCFRRVARQSPGHLRYPEALGRWPAAAGLVAFVWLEIVYGSSGGITAAISPHSTAVAALVYTVYTLAMMALFGVERWCATGETFSVYFGMFATLGPLEARDGRLGRRRPLSAATRWATVPGSVAVVVASIGTTSFDGGQEGVLKNAIESTFNRLSDTSLSLTWALRITDTVYLLLVVAGIATVYLLGVQGMRTIRNAPPARELRRAFAHTLIPIAFAYLVAHYFSLFVYQEQAQFTYLLSDPLGTTTTDLFGTASGTVNYGVISANAIWYVQVGALIAGHVCALVLGHDRALKVYGDARTAARSQYWMLALMVGFTSLGLFLLSQANG